MTTVRGNEDDPLSRGHICPKGVALADIYDDPDRLRRPMKRVGRATTWTEISWDEALDLSPTGWRRRSTSTAGTRSGSTSATPTRTRSAR